MGEEGKGGGVGGGREGGRGWGIQVVSSHMRFPGSSKQYFT